MFGGLHGAFSDSLPDGWGPLSMDRELKRRFDWQPYDITPLDRLAYIGTRAMGALEYAPATAQEPIANAVDLRQLAQAAEAMLQGQEGDVLQQLRIQGGSPGGEMAGLAGVLMPQTDLITVGQGRECEDYFAVQRFDRHGDSGKRHTLSLAGLLYADYRLPCLDYDAVLAGI